MRKIFNNIKKTIIIKTLISIISLGLFIPFIELIYWTFDTAYLSGFGISPDIYSRPIFSSGFINTWLFAESIQSIFIGWSLLLFIIFLMLFSINFSNLNKSQVNDPETIKFKKEGNIFRILEQLINVFAKSIAWPFYILICGIFIIMFTMYSIIWAHNKGLALAEGQLNNYVTEGKCLDKFNSKSFGCFDVKDIEDKDIFVITNTQKHILYLNRKNINASKLEKNDQYEIKIHIHEKEPGKEYSINRKYVAPKNEVLDTHSLK